MNIDASLIAAIATPLIAGITGYGALMRKLGKQDAELEALKREAKWQSATMIIQSNKEGGKTPTVPPPRKNLLSLTEFDLDEPWSDKHDK